MSPAVGIGTPPSPASECVQPVLVGGGGINWPAREGVGETQLRRGNTHCVVDQHRLDADPDSNFLFDADPDPDWHQMRIHVRRLPL